MNERDQTMGEADDFEDRLRRELREKRPDPDFPEAEIEAGIRRALESGAEAEDRSPGGSGAVGPGGGRRDGPSGRWWPGGTGRAVLAAAASLAIFVAGVEYGRRLAVPVGSGDVPAATPATEARAGVEESGRPRGADPATAPSLPLSIQASGSRYVASLARFGGEAATLSPEQRRVAREVAVAALYGAALELLSEWEEQESLREAVRLLSETRYETGSAVGGQRF